MILAALSALAAAIVPPVPAEVCAVIADPAAYDGRRIVVSGEFFTDWRHGAVILGVPCGRGLTLALTETAAASDAWRRIEATRPLGERPVITVTVTGAFRWDPDATGMFPPTHVLTIDTFDAVSIPPP